MEKGAKRREEERGRADKRGGERERAKQKSKRLRLRKREKTRAGKIQRKKKKERGEVTGRGRMNFRDLQKITKGYFKFSPNYFMVLMTSTKRHKSCVKLNRSE